MTKMTLLEKQEVTIIYPDENDRTGEIIDRR